MWSGGKSGQEVMRVFSGDFFFLFLSAGILAWITVNFLTGS